MRFFAKVALAALLFSCESPEEELGEQSSSLTLEPGTIKTSERVGTLPGSLDISADGTAVYAMPLWVPAGRAGIEPELGLSYSSRGSNGLLGVGWSLGGLSAVTTCDRTWAVDGTSSTTTNASCLDGQRLVVVTQTNAAPLPSDCTFEAEYRTLPDRFSRVIQCKATASITDGRWYVYARDGRIYRYVPSSQTFGRDAYLLTTVSDRVGNSMRVTYVANTDMPSEIRYTFTASDTQGTSATRTIGFEYEDRDDDSTRRRNGRAWTLTKRLKRIRALAGGATFRTYDFAYDPSPQSRRSLLRSVSTCDKEVELGGKCLPPTTFRYTSDAAGAEPWSRNPLEINGSVHPDFTPGNPLHFADMTGDGRDDMIFWINGTWYLRPSTGLDFGTATAQVSSLAGGAILYDVNGDGAVDLVDQTRVVIDLDGDGIPETTLPGTPVVYVWDFTVGRLVQASYKLPAVWRAPVHIVDLAGDGIPRYIDRASSNKLEVYANPFTGPNTTLDTPKVLDHPWDLTLIRDLGGYHGFSFLKTGADSASKSRVRWLPDNTFTPSVSDSLSTTDLGSCALWGDFNGDGYIDALNPMTRTLHMFHNGSSLAWSAAGPWWPTPLNPDGTVMQLPPCGEGNYQVADVNGDGRMDVVILGKRNAFSNNEQVKAFVTRPDGNGAELLAIGVMLTNSDVFADPLPPQHGARNSRLIDVNGEGQFDIFQMTSANTYRIHIPRTPPVDLLTDATDGLLRTDSVSYKSMANATELTRCTERGCFNGTLQIATELALDDGNGGKARFTHKFKNARVDRRGRGFVGFDVHEIVDARNNAVVRETYDNSPLLDGAPPGSAWYPRHGLPTELLSYVPDAANGFRWLVTRTQHTYFSSTTNGGATYHTYAGFSRTVTFDGPSFTVTPANVANPQLDCASRPRCSGVTSISDTSQSRDGFGNVTSVTALRYDTRPNATGTYLSTSSLDYAPAHNDVSRWLIGRPTTVTMSSTAPGFSDVCPPGLPSPCRRTITIAYDAFGNEVETEREPALLGTTLYKRTKLVRDPAWGVVTQVLVAANRNDLDAKTRVTTIGYDSNRIYPTSRSATTGEAAVPALVTSSVVHDALGVVLQRVDAAGIPTSYDHDGFGRPRGVRVAEGPTSTISYAIEAAPHAMTISTSSSDGARATSYLDRLGRTRRATTNGFDGRDAIVDTTYDGFGRVDKVTRPYFLGEAIRYAVSYEYDQVGRVTRSGQRNAPGASLEMTLRLYSGNQVQILDEVSNRTIEEYDGAGHLVRTAIAPGNANLYTSFTFGPFGQLRRVTDPKGNAVTFEYDHLGRRTATVDSNIGRVGTAYNEFDEPIEVTDAKQVKTASTYDQLGRLRTRVAPDGTDTFIWDTGAGAGRGKLASSARGDITTTYAYDFLGRVQNERWAIGTEAFDYTYEYDAQHRLKTLHYPAKGTSGKRFAVRHLYNANGYLEELTNASDPAIQPGPRIWIADVADAQGRIRQERFGNGRLTTHTFDPVSNLLERVTTSGVHDVSYVYNANGMMKSRTDHLNAPYGFTSGPPPYSVARTETFTYDRANRLKTTTIPERGTFATYTIGYDDLGNVISSDDQDACINRVFGGPGYGPHQLARVTCFSTNYAFSYDANGNETMSVSPDFREQTWTSFNKQREVRNRYGRMLYTYDANHQRVRKEKIPGALSFMSEPQTPLLNDGLSGVWSTTIYAGSLFEKRTSSAPTIDHVYTVSAGRKIIGQLTWAQSKSNPASGTDDWRYFHTDAQGTVERSTDAAGTLKEAQSFDAWGARRNVDWAHRGEVFPSHRTRMTFTGHEYEDEFGGFLYGLINMRGRSYDPFSKRFTSADPFVQAPAYGPSWNRYSYVFNNPLNLIDPSGYAGCPYEQIGCIEGDGGGGGGGGGVSGGRGINWDKVGNAFGDFFSGAGSVLKCVFSAFSSCGGGGRPVGPGARQGGPGTIGAAQESTNRTSTTVLVASAGGIPSANTVAWGAGRDLPLDLRIGRSQTGSYEATLGLWGGSIYRERTEGSVGSITSEWGSADLRAGVTFGRSFNQVDLVAKAKARVLTQQYRAHTRGGDLSASATITVAEVGAQASVGTSGVDARIEASIAKVRSNVETCFAGMCLGAYGEAGLTVQLGIAAGLTTGAAVGPFAGYVTVRADDRPFLGDVIRESLGLPPPRPLPPNPGGMQVGPLPPRSAWPR